VIFSDDLSMEAARHIKDEPVGLSDAVLAALNAGCDQVLICNQSLEGGGVLDLWGSGKVEVARAFGHGSGSLAASGAGPASRLRSDGPAGYRRLAWQSERRARTQSLRSFKQCPPPSLGLPSQAGGLRDACRPGPALDARVVAVRDGA